MWSIAMLVLCFLWFLSEILINFVKRSRQTVSDSYDHNSLNIIWIAIILSTTTGVFVAFTFPRFNEIEYASGVLLIIFGLSLRFISIFTLKSFFTSNVSIHHDHKLKTTGIYKLVRHPSYTGSLLSFLGLGLALGNWVSILIIFLPVLAAFLYRINIEEKVLLNNFKGEYLEYKKRTKKLIPYLF
jgi:protein-S-isoprenylcysteine O-methyltransferase Ste14